MTLFEIKDLTIKDQNEVLFDHFNLEIKSNTIYDVSSLSIQQQRFIVKYLLAESKHNNKIKIQNTAVKSYFVKNMTVKENIAYISCLLGINEKKHNEIITVANQTFFLPSLWLNLKEADRQSIALIIALSIQPDILILDTIIPSNLNPNLSNYIRNKSKTTNAIIALPENIRKYFSIVDSEKESDLTCIKI